MIPVNDDIHVIPLNDLHEHIMSVSCPCNPTVEVVGAALIIIHNSWDRREFVEQIEQWLFQEDD